MNCAMWVGGTPWSLRVFQHCFFRALCKCFLNFGFSISAFSEVFFTSQRTLFIPTLPYLSNRICAECISGLYMVYSQIKWAFCIFHTLRSFILTIAFTNSTGSFSQLSVAINFGAEGLTWDTLAPVYVFVCRSLYFINSTSSAVLIRVTSPQHRL